MTLVFQFQLDAAESVRAQGVLTREMRSFQISSVVLCALPVSVFATSLWSGSSVPRALVSSMPMAVTLLVMFLLVMPWLQRRAVRKTFVATPSFRHPQTYEFSERGLAMSNPLASSALRWEGIVRVRETSEFFLFYFSKRYAYFLPKRVFRNASEEAELRAFVASHVHASAPPLSNHVPAA
jgi:hypothetical protein